MVNNLHKSGWILIIAVLFWSSCASAAVIAQVDRYNITLDETLNLSIEVTGDDSGDPDLASLETDFEIVSRNQSNSYSLINGSMSSKSIWYLVLRPRHAGALRIPALSVGKKKTSAIIIQVSKVIARKASAGATPQGDLWIDMSAEPSTVYVQQQSIINLRIYQAISLNQAQLSEPVSDHALVIRLGKDKNYQVNRDGRNWAVTERRYAVFPQQHGILKLEPVQLDGSVIAGRAYGSMFQTTKPVRVRSNALQLNVKAMPANWKAASWLPAKKVELIETWPQGEFHVGDSITRTINLRADGLSSSQLPELTTLLPDHLKAYADKPVLSDDKQSDGIIGNRQEKLAILATRPGTFILPPINLTWWDINSQSLQTASLPARTFTVLAAPVDTSAETTALQDVKPQTNKTAQQSSHANQAISPWWKWLALFSISGWLLTLTWFLRRTKPAQEQATHRSIDLSKLKKEISKTCQHHQAKSCEQALLNFAQAQWPNNNINSLTALIRYCDAALAAEITLLEQHLYGLPNDNRWQGDSLRSAFEQTTFSKPNQPDNSTPKTALPGLYPDE